MHIEHANRAATAIPASAPEYVKKRIELRRAGKRKRTVKAKTVTTHLAPQSAAASEDELMEAQLAVLKAYAQ